MQLCINIHYTLLTLLDTDSLHIIFLSVNLLVAYVIHATKGHRGRDRMVVGFTTTYAISAYYH